MKTVSLKNYTFIPTAYDISSPVISINTAGIKSALASLKKVQTLLIKIAKKSVFYHFYAVLSAPVG